MPRFCYVKGCKTRKKDHYRYFRIPSGTDYRGEINPEKAERRRQWIEAMEINENINLQNVRICETHFVTGHPFDNRAHPDWVPSLNMPGKSDVDDVVAKLAKYEEKAALERINKLTEFEKIITQDDPVASTSTFVGNIKDDHAPSTFLDKSPAEDSSMDDSFVMVEDDPGKFRTPESARKRVEMKELRNSQNFANMIRMVEDTVKNNNVYLKYYSGLPNYTIIRALVDVGEPFMDRQCTLNAFQQFMLTCMKLRLGMQFTDLAYRFNVDRRTCSRVFYKWIDILHKKLKKCVRWPEREELQAKMPNSFKETFGNKVAVIIDCFELFIQNSGNPEIQSQIFSSYKHHHTLKFLIGVSPTGCIIFISKAYVGRTSDTIIAENCGILENLLPNDIILADRGFYIQDSVNIYMATLKQPAFLKGQKQLCPEDIEESRKVAHVRVHVERAIGYLRRKYTILSQILPYNVRDESNNEELCMLDKIVFICCALVNLCPPIIK